MYGVFNEPKRRIFDLQGLMFSKLLNSFYIKPEKEDVFREGTTAVGDDDIRFIEQHDDIMSAPDFLYRLRCLFPHLKVKTHHQHHKITNQHFHHSHDCENSIFSATITHLETGYTITFLEDLGAADIRLDLLRGVDFQNPQVVLSHGNIRALNLFSRDLCGLLNTFVETEDVVCEEKERSLVNDQMDKVPKDTVYFKYFHPSAKAIQLPQHLHEPGYFLSAPHSVSSHHSSSSEFKQAQHVSASHENDNEGIRHGPSTICKHWKPTIHQPPITELDRDFINFSNLFSYNVTLKKFESIPSSTLQDSTMPTSSHHYIHRPLHYVISSSLLFYRLLCLFDLPDTPCITISPNSSNNLDLVPKHEIVTGVWSVMLKHMPTGGFLYFRDDQGLACCFVSKGLVDQPGFVADVLRLMELLVLEVFPHPFFEE
ncbi:hypothetical protein HDU76_002256 [Blyttiomyces sp. JEL0837]|nr:hypothetical protein HDU76_002256 [Blyttiomyces sp. JEL0837]